MEKLTKKQREELVKQARLERRRFVEAIEGYWKDCEAAKRYLSTKGESLTDEERERLFRKYDELKDYQISYNEDELEHMWSVIRTIVNCYRDRNERKYKHLSVTVEEDDLVVDDILWGLDDTRLIVKEARKYGYKRILYTDNSTAAMRGIGSLVEMGAKVEGSLYNIESDRWGVILNIESVDYEVSYIDDEVMREDIRTSLTSLGSDVTYSFRTRSIKEELISKYAKHYGAIKTYETYMQIYNDVVSKVGE